MEHPSPGIPEHGINASDDGEADGARDCSSTSIDGDLAVALDGVEDGAIEIN